MPASSKQAQARDFKHRVLTCLHKLSDRDTHAAAASELESIARTLPVDALPSFISSISATDSSDRSPVRRHCIRLVAVLAAAHGDALSPHLSRILSAVARRLRDPDSSVRAACVAAALSLASHLASAPFTTVAKPFLESLFAEQEASAQNGAALCLAAVIEGSTNPDVGGLRKLLPRLEKLAKCESFKAKAAILALVGSLVAVEGVLSGGGRNAVRNLIACLTELLSSEDWAARKAAAEALMKMALVERDALSEYKASCLKTFEAKRFDKVKAARETMNQMVQAWKEIPDLTDEVSSKEIGPGNSHIPSQVEKISPLASPASAPRRRTSLGSNGNRTSPPMFRKLESKKPSNTKADLAAAAAPTSSPVTSVSGDKRWDGEEGRRFEKIKRALFDERQHEIGCRGVESSVVVSNETRDMCRNQSQRDSEDLSLIRKQLVQIENQQSNLLEILQRFIGSSQRGIHSLEARVHGLELALDEISFDLAISTGKTSTAGASSCCSLPGAEFLNLKLRKKTQARAQASSRLPASCEIPPSVTPVAGSVLGMDEDGGGGGFSLQRQRRPLRGGRGVIVMNPLAEIPLQEVSLKGHA
ncbi:TORTIFOLIA1-like protein 5 [Salvia miltiorrhiza]|uniref:TORTIFOLIA1-like protein 5 n=1 Tax=Salvia miltiorrhiza TaxID=226208 RepID=UPI0025AC191B|nr:TORTIFOLIA1-like protein 5 [Salvia miltiorrhiza]